MKKLILALAFAVSGQGAFAADFAYPETFKVQYNLDNNVGPGQQVYYNCSSVESNVRSILKQLGAEKAKVRCSGGFDTWSPPMPAYVTAQFTAATSIKNANAPRAAAVKEVVIRTSDDCHFVKATLEALSEVMELNVVDGPSSCSLGSRISSKYTVSVLSFAD